MSVREGGGGRICTLSVREGAGWGNMYGVSEGGGGRICTLSVREGAGWENQESINGLNTGVDRQLATHQKW